MEILAQISELQNKAGSCKNVNWEAYLNYWKTPMTQNANDRSWLYQTCSEFGFYQTCNKDSECPYGKGYHDVSRDLELCQVAFGIEPDTVRKNVDSTLSYYGGWSLAPHAGEEKVGPKKRARTMLENDGATSDGQKRIIFITGGVDPWTELSFTQGGSKDHPSISVQGASHHFWTHEAKESDSHFVASARQTIYDTVSDWLGVSAHSLPSVGDEPTVVVDIM